MIEYSDFVSSIKKEEEEKIETAVSTSWRALSGLSYGAGLKVITSNLAKVQIVFKETVTEFVSEDDYDKALNVLIILNSATELFKASSAWQEEVYSKLASFSLGSKRSENPEELLESKEESQEVQTSSTLPNAEDTQYSSSSNADITNVESDKEKTETNSVNRTVDNFPLEKMLEAWANTLEPSPRQKYWVILRAVELEPGKRRGVVLDKALALLTERNWPSITKERLTNIISTCVTAVNPSLEYVNPEKARCRGFRLTDKGSRLLQILTSDLENY